MNNKPLLFIETPTFMTKSFNRQVQKNKSKEELIDEQLIQKFEKLALFHKKNKKVLCLFKTEQLSIEGILTDYVNNEVRIVGENKKITNIKVSDIVEFEILRI